MNAAFANWLFDPNWLFRSNETLAETGEGCSRTYRIQYQPLPGTMIATVAVGSPPRPSNIIVAKDDGVRFAVNDAGTDGAKVASATMDQDGTITISWGTDPGMVKVVADYEFYRKDGEHVEGWPDFGYGSKDEQRAD